MEPKEAYETSFDPAEEIGDQDIAGPVGIDEGGVEDEEEALEPVDSFWEKVRSIILPWSGISVGQRRLIYRYNSKKSDIYALDNELKRAGYSSRLPDVDTTLEFAWAAIMMGDIDSYWRQYTKIREWELKTIAALEDIREKHTPDDVDEDITPLVRTLSDEAQSVLSDATAKLTGAELELVTSRLTDESGGVRKDVDYQDITTANRVLHERYIEEYYNQQRASALKDQFLWFIITTFISVFGVLGVLTVKPDIFQPGQPIIGPFFVGTVIVFGTLGASVSGLLSLSEVLKKRSIPDSVNTFWIAVGRIVAGGAGALVIYVFLLAGFAELLFRIDVLTPAMAIAISFMAGFSERLFLRSIEALPVGGQQVPQ